MKKFLSALLPALVFGACSSNSDGGSPQVIPAGNDNDSGSGTTGASGTTGGLPSSGATSVGLPPTGGFVVTNGGNSTTGGVTEVCAGVKLDPEIIEVEVPREVVTVIETEVPMPLALYVVLDNSLSMGPSGGFPGPGAGGAGNEPPSKWKDAVDALTNFVDDPNSDGVEIGLQYFNPPTNAPGTDLCDGSFQGEPAVDVGPLPENADAIVQSLDGSGPTGSTPTVGAMEGGVAFCTAFKTENPDYQCVVIMVTDGQPNECGLSSTCPDNPGSMDCVDPLAQSTLTPIAADGLTAGVNTFTVGMAGISADGFALLDAIAVAGGTDCTPGAAGDEACDVSETGSSGLLAALETIRDTVTVTETMTETVTDIVYETEALPCEWELPDPPDGETLDPDLVNVILTIDGVAGDPIGRVASEGDCAGVATGWHYDDPEAPTTISVCPQTCDQVKNGNVSVQVDLGCETEIAIPE